METREIVIKMQVLSYEELSKEDKKLIEEAKSATQRAYAPYSKFQVGAAVLLENQEIHTGSNQENAAYPSGLCAERTCLFSVHSLYPKQRIEALAIAGFTGGDYVANPLPPCGACRQVIKEYEDLQGSPIRILLYGKKNIYILSSGADLIPVAFELS